MRNCIDYKLSIFNRYLNKNGDLCIYMLLMIEPSSHVDVLVVAEKQLKTNILTIAVI